MGKEIKRNWVRTIIMILALGAFAIFTPGAAEQWWRIGMGLSYDKQLSIAGLTHQQSKESATHELRVNKAKKDGIIYAALMVNGTHLPLLGFVLVTTAILTIPFNQTINKKLLLFFPIIYVWGSVFSGFAHLMISSPSLIDALLGGCGIWIGFTALFGVVILIGLFVRKLFLRLRYS